MSTIKKVIITFIVIVALIAIFVVMFSGKPTHVISTMLPSIFF